MSSKESIAEKNYYLLNIQYLIKLPKHSVEVSYSWPNRHDRRFLPIARILTKISNLQKDIAEIYFEKEISIRNRMTGLFDGYNINFISSFDKLKDSPYFIKVLFTDEILNENQVDCSTIIIIYDEISENGLPYIYFSDLNPSLLKKRITALIQEVFPSNFSLFNELKSYEKVEPEYTILRHPQKISNSYYTKLNLNVLESLRILLIEEGETTEYIRNDILSSVNLINLIRRETKKNFDTMYDFLPTSYYFTDMSSNLEFASYRKLYTEASLRNKGIVDPHAMIEAIKYSDRGIIGGNNNGNNYILELEKERQLLDSFIVLAAASEVSPIIRIPLNNIDVYSDVRNMGANDRGNRKKINSLMIKLKSAFVKHLDYWLEYLDHSPSSSIKFVSNLPLEWGEHQGLPLMIRHEVSRIPITPGYIADLLLLDTRKIHLSLDNFKEILFISSFSKDDPIRNDVKHAISVLQSSNDPEKFIKETEALGIFPREIQASDLIKSKLDIRIKWIDIANKVELIEAINQNPCAITVFDLHGGHDENGGVIHLKDEVVSIFEIYQDINISPIVILSACDTNPIDKAHSSTAEAFFLAGAKTVLASGLPIQSDLASIFLARLIERLKWYLPFRVIDHKMPIQWSTLVTGMIRRTYFYELICLLQKELKFDQKKKSRTLYEVGKCLDPLMPNWVQATRQKILVELNINEIYLDKFIISNVQFIECMKYFQLGRPENIIITADRNY